MTPPDPWFAWYPGDYLRDTGGLTMLQHGAYRCLLDRYYDCGGPLSRDPETLYRLAGAFSGEERHAVDIVVSKFFVADGEQIRHARADAEIARRAEKRAMNRELGRRGGIKSAGVRWGKGVSERLGERSSERSSKNTVIKGTTSARSRRADVERIYEDPDFTQFWTAYPRKVDKADAATAWSSLHDIRPETAVILDAVRRQSATEDWRKERGKFIPYPATWLNARRWEDETPEVTHDKPDVY